jgi:hypothetical protein
VDKVKKGGHTITVGQTHDGQNSTSNLLQHIRRCHADLAVKIQDAEDKEALKDKPLADKPMLEIETQALSKSLDSWVIRTSRPSAETIDVVLALWAIQSGISWNAFSNDCWDRVRRHLEKAIPSGDTLRRSTFPRVYELVRRCIVAELQEVEACAATSDSWSIGDKNLVSLTVDYVDSGLVAHSSCGGSSWNLRDHSADSIREAWDSGPLMEMPNCVMVGAIVCDGGSNFQLAGRESLGEDAVLLCMCHGLNRGARVVANDTGISGIFDKLDHLINYVYGSSSRQKRFEATVQMQ